jgi:hypothetical protein
LSKYLTRQETLATTATAAYDGGRAERKPGFTPKTTLAEGVLKVEEWLHAARVPRN